MMRWENGRPPRWLSLLCFGAGAVGWILTSGRLETSAAPQSNFMGGNPEFMESEDVSTLRLRFPAGVRSNWHTHTDGQLLRGGPVLEMLPGEPWWTETGVEHWHGAALDEDAVQLTIYAGQAVWLEPVSDEEYRVPSQRP